MRAMVKKKLCLMVVGIRRVSNQVMTVVLVVDEDVLRLTSGHKLGRWDMQMIWLSMGDVNGHMGRHVDGFHGIGQRNEKGRMLPKSCLCAKYIC